ncbi:MAG: hypothetical protein IJZ55_11390 [Lachnospiraceae bacterium]|nr:hypothetical protein [Lachnospiraceae bacterium]
MKKKVTFRQIFAAVGLLLLVGMYVVSFVLALMAKPGAEGMFMASLLATIIIPILIYGFLVLDKWARKNAPQGMSYREVRKYNKRLKNGEDPEKLAKEIEEKYGVEEEEEDSEEDETADSVEVSEEESDAEE